MLTLLPSWDRQQIWIPLQTSSAVISLWCRPPVSAAEAGRTSLLTILTIVTQIHWSVKFIYQHPACWDYLFNRRQNSVLLLLIVHNNAPTVCCNSRVKIKTWNFIEILNMQLVVTEIIMKRKALRSKIILKRKIITAVIYLFSGQAWLQSRRRCKYHLLSSRLCERDRAHHRLAPPFSAARSLWKWNKQ